MGGAFAPLVEFLYVQHFPEYKPYKRVARFFNPVFNLFSGHHSCLRFDFCFHASSCHVHCFALSCKCCLTFHALVIVHSSDHVQRKNPHRAKNIGNKSDSIEIPLVSKGLSQKKSFEKVSRTTVLDWNSCRWYYCGQWIRARLF